MDICVKKEAQHTREKKTEKKKTIVNQGRGVKKKERRDPPK